MGERIGVFLVASGITGTLTIKNGKLVRVVLKAGYPMIDRIAIVFTVLLAETNVEIALGKT